MSILFDEIWPSVILGERSGTSTDHDSLAALVEHLRYESADVAVVY